MMVRFREVSLKISCDLLRLGNDTRNSGRFAEACGTVDIMSDTDDFEAQIEQLICSLLQGYCQVDTGLPPLSV
jgi:hypothetical protein